MRTVRGGIERNPSLGRDRSPAGKTRGYHQYCCPKEIRMGFKTVVEEQVLTEVVDLSGNGWGAVGDATQTGDAEKCVGGSRTTHATVSVTIRVGSSFEQRL